MSQSQPEFQLWPKENSYFGPTTRSVEITGEITDEGASKAIGQILTLQTLDKTAPIQVIINSPGGSFYAGLAIFDILRTVPNPILAFGVGFVGSAALLVYMAGDIRQCTPATTFFYHNVISWNIVESANAGEELYKHYKWCNTQMQELISKRLNINKQNFADIFGTSTTHNYITAREAKKHKLVDKIIPYRSIQ